MGARGTRNTAVGLAVLLTVALLLSAPAQAQTYPPKPPSIGVNDTLVRPGDKVVVSGADWCPGSTVDIFLNGKFITTADVGGDGTFSTSITVPAGTDAGPAEITVEGLDETCDETRVLGRTITVVLGATESGGNLPFTGENVSVWMLVVAGLMVVGAGFAVAGRRREKHLRR